MPEFSSGIQQVIDGQGVPISVAGMTIVFSVLTTIAGFIAMLPKVLEWVNKVLPESAHHGPTSRPVPKTMPAPVTGDLSSIAAAALAYHTRHFQGTTTRDDTRPRHSPA
ncbi:MAG: OadG family protein [Candidatus Latescibacterota bacterium]|nr:OadG family protein [Candidatus Latescibacterota bacterium]